MNASPRSELAAWERAVRHADSCGHVDELETLRAQGVALLTAADFTDAAWPRAWGRCMRSASEETHARLLVLGEAWFIEHYARFESSRVLEGLRKHPFPRAMYSALWGWLRTHPASPLWVQIAVRILHVDPTAPDALDTLETLLADPKAEVHRRTFPALLKVRKTSVPMRRRILQDLGYTEEEISKWIAWRMSLANHTSPVVWATVEESNTDRIAVDGFEAHWTTALRPLERERGMRIPVRVRTLDEVARTLGVSLWYVDPDETVIPGVEENGTVTTVQQYGIFVRFRNFVGLAHVAHFPAAIPPESFSPGTPVRVRVMGVKKQRVELALLA